MNLVRRGAALVLALGLVTGCASNPDRDSAERGQDRSQIYLELGAAHLQQGEPRKALEKLRKAESINEEDPRVYNVMGLTYQRLGFDDKAEDAFQQALDLEPGNP
ncbi:MAG: tetratricopeptide repeat protein, partial [Thiohalorhabdaceae bacterium]